MNLFSTEVSILWPALIAGILVVISHVPLGQQVFARGIVFIDLAIAQVAGLGVIAASGFGLPVEGWSAQAAAGAAALAGALLADMVLTYPALGYHPKGFVVVREEEGAKKKETEYRGLPALGKIRQLPTIIRDHGIQEVLIGLDSTEHDQLLEIIRYCNGYDVGMKIIPDLYDIVSGQARVSSIYGFPLMEVMPELMKPWESAMKRLIDITVALVILVAGSPVWVLVALAVKFDSRGPIFYRQERVGKNGAIFNVLKFRS